MKSSPVDGCIMRGFSKDNIEGQLMAMCLQAEHDVWLQLLPKDDDNDSIFFNTGHNWEHMYPCLYKACFMNLDKASGKVIINRHQWESFCLISDVWMQMGTYCGDDSRPQFFIAIGDRLKYDSPGEQIKDGYSMPCSLPSNEDIELRQYFGCAWLSSSRAKCVRNPLYKMQIQFQLNCELKSYFYSNYWFIHFIHFNLVVDISFHVFDVFL
jgi:hypothetical protein